MRWFKLEMNDTLNVLGSPPFNNRLKTSDFLSQILDLVLGREDNSIINYSSLIQDEIVFPKLKVIWDEVENLNIDAARAYLSNYILSEGATVTMVGMSFDEAMALRVVPIIQIVFLLY